MSPKPVAKNSIRIIGGELRSRRVEFMDADGLRPTGDRIRETLFNWLQNDVAGATCLDLFAGSGALGFEALSRGAKLADLVESDRRVASAIRDNAARLQLGNCTVVNTTAEDWLRQQAGQEPHYDIAFLDPPFADDRLAETCAKLDASGVMRENSLVYLESDKAVTDKVLPSGWQQIKSKQAGQVYFYLYRLVEATD